MIENSRGITGGVVKHRVCLAAVVSLLFAIATPSAQGANILVTTLQQKISGNGGCSLQEAIYSANFDSPIAIQGYNFTTNTAITVNTQCVQGSGSDRIILPAGAVFSLNTIVDDADNPMGPTATPMITSNVTIEANGATLQWLGSKRARLFAVGSTGHLAIRNAYIKDFTTKGGNGADGGGGGMGAGGAIYVMPGGSLTVDGSTLASNSAAGGNGSTLNESAGGGGGGLSGNGSTPVANTEDTGGGGGGGSRGNGGTGFISGPAGYGGDGGGTVTGRDTGGGIGGGFDGFDPGCSVSGALSSQNGQDGGTGGGGGGGEATFLLVGCLGGGNGGRGGYGGGGGGGGDIAGSGGDGGFGGGGGASSSSASVRAGGGNGNFGGGGGASPGGTISGGPGHGGAFGGNADENHGGGGGALGGAIFNDSGSVTIKNSTLANNVVVRGSGSGGSSDNGADAGGAIFSRNGILEVVNSTISGNQGTGSGAGIVVVGDGGTASFTLNNTIIYANGAQECFVRGAVAMAGVGNLIGGNGNGGSFVPCPGPVTGADPQLGPLQLNFPGNTPTMAIPQGSSAWNTADASTSFATDQRGEPRPSMGGFDIGAFELCIERFGPGFRVCQPPPEIVLIDDLTVLVAPAGAGTTNPAAGVHSETDGSVVLLNATPKPGYSFLSWAGNIAADSVNASNTVVMNGPQTVIANFVAGNTVLGGNILTKSGPQNARIWPINVANTGAVASHSAQISTFTLTQTFGAACMPALVTPLPALAGDLAPGLSATVNLWLDFTGCAATARFTAQATFSANGGGVTGSMTRTNQFQ